MLRFAAFIALLMLCLSCRQPEETNDWTVTAPGGAVKVDFFLTEARMPAYRVWFDEMLVLDTSFLGFELLDSPDMKAGFEVKNSSKNTFRDSWRPVYGENAIIENYYDELSVQLGEAAGLKRQMTIVFRVYDDGLGFRYELPEQENLQKVRIAEELTQFHLTGDHTAWWIPADYDSYEYLYTQSRLSEVDATKAGYKERHDRHVGNLKAVNTPLTMKTEQGLYLSIHEANLTNYAGMTLGVDSNSVLRAELVPALDGSKVTTQTPFVTPWRTIQIGKHATDLLKSNLIINLNEPNQLEDVSRIKPMKYNGVWWEIHIGKSSWDYDTGIHGANTANVLRYMDFAANNNIGGTLVEGWNIGWDNWGNKTFSLTDTYPDFDIERIVEYGREKGVELIGHHETFGNVAYYDSIVEDAFKYYYQRGVHYVKTGYAAGLNPGEFHHSQYMVNHYRRVVQLAAKYHICLDAHEPIKPTGIRRTYPNMMTREGVRGMEYNAWGGGNPPSHTTILPFTRGLAGPMDYTPGIFDVKFEKYRKDQYVRSTIAKQLALYVVLYSPLQMVADLPENYKDQPATQFIKDVGVDWEKTVILNGEIGSHVTIARKEKSTGNWFLGAITNEAARKMELHLDFLAKGKQYEATIYADAPDAHWDKNPTAYTISKQMVQKGTVLKVDLAPGGGCAISFRAE